MAKIVLIGAGSHVFSRNLITDFLSSPELRAGTVTLMDLDREQPGPYHELFTLASRSTRPRGLSVN